jgi:transposase
VPASRPYPSRVSGAADITSTLALIDDFTREIDHDQRTSEVPHVEVLRQIRGVGRYIAMLVIAEVGDITRFHTARQQCAWTGMTPTVHTSGMRTRLGHISHQGSPALRWALIEAAPLERARVLSMASTPTLTDGMTAAHFDDVVARARGDPEHGLVPGRATPLGIEEELLEDGRGRELDQARAA